MKPIQDTAAVELNCRHGRASLDMQAVALPQIGPPPYAPELNPGARFVEEGRRAIAGHHYRSLRAKKHAVTVGLRQGRDDPARIRQRCG